MLQKIKNWFDNAYKAVSVFLKEYKIKNAGWLGVFILCLIFFKGFPLLMGFGFVSLGIFIEKNRRQLVDIFKQIKDSKK